jgi:transcriptional regulator with XRE-family HTH domain
VVHKPPVSADLFNPHGMTSASASVAAMRMASTAGTVIREARRARRWTLRDLAGRAGVALGTVHAVKAGRPMSLETYARIATALGLRPSLVLENPRRIERPTSDLVHGAMGELEAGHLKQLGFEVAMDEPYQHYQFAGRADVLAWSLEEGALLHIENKTRLQDLQELAGSYNAKRRYLPAVMAERLGLGPSRAGWRTVTHVLAVLWSSEALHVLRLRPATFEALCPDADDPFEAWWTGTPPRDG